jgi:hypothetical protein
LIEDKYYKNPEYQKYKAYEPEYWSEMDAKLNGAYILMGLLYGEGDPDKTITVSMQCGRDSDCNPSNAGGVLFASIGYDNLDEKYISKLNMETKFSYTNYNFPGLTQVSLKLAKQFVLNSGGKIEKDSEGKEYFLIPKINAQPGKLEQSWESVPYAGDNKFSKEEMSKIKFTSYQSFTPLIKEWEPNIWKVYNNSSATEPKLISWKGKDDIIKTSLQNEKGAVKIIMETVLPKNKKSYLTFSVSADDTGDWDLVVRGNYDIEILRETIKPGTLDDGWKDYVIDLTEYAGIDKTLVVSQEASGGNPGNAYWYNIKLVSE